MSVVPMRRAFVLAHQAHREELISRLNESGLMHVLSIRDEPDESVRVADGAQVSFSRELREHELLLAKITFAIEFLDEFAPRKKGFISSMVKEKVHLSWRDFANIGAKLDFDDIYEKCEELDGRRTHIENRRAAIVKSLWELEPWEGLDIPLSEAGVRAAGNAANGGVPAGDAVGAAAPAAAPAASVMLGLMPASNVGEAVKALAETAPLSDMEVVSTAGQESAVTLLVHADSPADVAGVLTPLGFREIDLGQYRVSSAEEMEALRQEQSSLERQAEELSVAAGELLYVRRDLLILHDYVANEKAKIAIRERFEETDAAFLIEGWIQEADEDALRRLVAEVGDEAEVSALDVGPDENPPVHLKNAPWMQPFEQITRLFGLPNYRELDPTPLLAPFFILFFGIAIGDVGYGLVLALGARWLMRRYDLAENTRKFMVLFVYGGITSMIVGVLTGGWFGVDSTKLPSFLKAFMIIDPLGQAAIFLVATWAMGLLQLSFGIMIEFYDTARNGDFADAVYSQLTTLLFVWASAAWLTVWVIGIMSKPMAAPLAGAQFALSIALMATALGVIFCQGNWVAETLALVARHRPVDMASLAYNLAFLGVMIAWMAGWLGLPGLGLSAVAAVFVVGLLVKPWRGMIIKFLEGLYSLYGMSAFIGDVLSYSRLMALGLATVLIGVVINMAPTALIESGRPWYQIVLGLIAMAIPVAVLHLFNVVINLLGAFVHPLRLQYVEFFPKFYEDGGVKFTPFSLETKRLVIARQPEG